MIGFRYPVAWAFPLLTKVAPGIGLLWFVVRREWRNLAIALDRDRSPWPPSRPSLAPRSGMTGTTCCGAASPTARSVEGAYLAIPVWARLPFAVAIIVWGARTDRHWTVPVGILLAMPILWINVFTLLVAVVPLREEFGLTPARAWLLRERLLPAALRSKPATAPAGRLRPGHTPARSRPPAPPVPFATMAFPGTRHAPAPAAWPTLGQLWTFLAVALPALAALLVPMPAVDLAYQLRAGADILAGHGIPTVDTWTFTVAGTPWLDQQWGAQVLLAGVFQAAGWTGPRHPSRGARRADLRAAARGASEPRWSLASVRAGGSAIASSARTATLIVLGAFAVAAPALALRPQLFAIVLFAATLLILVERAAHPRRLWLIPVIAAAWANLHGSFPLVVVLVGLVWLDEVALLREPTPAGPAPATPAGSTARLDRHRAHRRRRRRWRRC